MLKFTGAVIVSAVCTVPCFAHDVVAAACREEARGLKGAEYQHYVRVCVAYERTVQAMRVASACRTNVNGMFPARACVTQASAR